MSKAKEHFASSQPVLNDTALQDHLSCSYNLHNSHSERAMEFLFFIKKKATQLFAGLQELLTLKRSFFGSEVSSVIVHIVIHL